MYFSMEKKENQGGHLESENQGIKTTKEQTNNQQQVDPREREE